jgi:hypothetical protein
LLARYAIHAGQNSPGKELRLNIFALNKFQGYKYRFNM